MSRHDGTGARTVRGATMLMIPFLLLSSTVDLVADCPDPSTLTDPTLGDTLVTPSSAQGHNAALGMDCQARFILAWEEVDTTALPNHILVLRYDEVGAVICNSGDVCPAPLTNAPDDPVGEGVRQGCLGWAAARRRVRELSLLSGSVGPMFTCPVRLCTGHSSGSGPCLCVGIMTSAV